MLKSHYSSKVHVLWNVFSDSSTQWSQNLSALDLRDLHLLQGLVSGAGNLQGGHPFGISAQPSPQDTGGSFKCITVTHSCIPPLSPWSHCSCAQLEWNEPVQVRVGLGVKDWV